MWSQYFDGRRRAEAKSYLGLLEMGLLLYRTSAGEYPTTAQGLDALVHAPTLPPLPRGWKPLMTDVSLDPWGRPYVYTRGTANCELRSHGWNTRDVSDDVILVFPNR